MRISELSRRTLFPVPTIKFYLREGLLPAGTLTARNQARYGTEHVDRLRLIRIFTEVGGLPLSSIRGIFAAIEDDQLPLHHLCRVVHRALHTPRSFGDAPAEVADARADLDEYIDALGWQVPTDAPERDTVAGVLAALQRFGWGRDVRMLAPYVEAADQIAAHEMTYIAAARSRAEAAATLVIGSVLLEAALVGLRRLAEEHHSGIRFSVDVEPDRDPATSNLGEDKIGGPA